MNDRSDEYNTCMMDMYELAEREGISQLDTAWLFLNEVYWPNPHYHGEPVNHPEDPTGTQTNPPLSTKALRDRCLQRQKERGQS